MLVFISERVLKRPLIYNICLIYLEFLTSDFAKCCKLMYRLLNSGQKKLIKFINLRTTNLYDFYNSDFHEGLTKILQNQ